jgi:hypothetical protein
MGVVARDHAVALQAAHALRTGRGRKADLLGQLGHGDAAVALQDVEDLAIGAVEHAVFTSGGHGGSFSG